MTQFHQQHRSVLVLFIVLKLSVASEQTYQTDVLDVFHNTTAEGPVFDQVVYTPGSSRLSVGSPINTIVFIFNVKPHGSTVDAMKNGSETITVTSSEASFLVVQLTNSSYALITALYPLNYFSPYHRYLFNLITADRFSNQSSTAIVQINLSNYNVHAPVFDSHLQSFSVSETTTVGTEFGTVFASDADGDIILFGLRSSQFSIHPTTGVLRLNQNLQLSSVSEFNVTVTATDDGSSCGSLSSNCPQFITSTTITIKVTAVNKQSPQFIDQICGTNISFYENNLPGASLIFITVVDDDRGNNGQMTISLLSEQSLTSTLKNASYSHFQIQQLPQINSTRTAVLQVKTRFDYDTPGAPRLWYLQILAADNGTPQRLSLCSLGINLLDRNDNPPVFLMTSWNYTIYFSAFDTVVNPHFLRTIASDADSGINAVINYYILTPNVSYFTINETIGTIGLRENISLSNLDVNQFPIIFQVYAQDRGSPPLKSQINATVTIYFNNGNDTLPARWLDSRYEELHIIIREKFYETYPNTSIFDMNFNGMITYQLRSPMSSIMNVSSPFINSHIPFRNAPVRQNNQTFISGIVVTSALHAEIQDVYLIYIHVPVDPLLVGITTITLIDENDQIPRFDDELSSMVLSVVENEMGNRTLIQIQAFDRDVTYPNNYVQYRLNSDLSDSSAIGKFFITPDGVIWTNAVFDRESQSFYHIVITAYDGASAWNSSNGSPNTQDIQLNVQVIDVNDAVPAFMNSSILISINETTAIGTSILNLTVTDIDFDTILHFNILNGNIQNVFTFSMLYDNSVDSNRTWYQATGQLSVVGSLSYEVRQSYTLVLFAWDTLNLASTIVTINILPQNAKPPVFQLMSGFNAYEYLVDEMTPVSVLNGSIITAIDPDRPGTTFVYSIVTNVQQNLNSCYLNQSNNKATIGVAPPGLSQNALFARSVYQLAIRATDQGGRSVSSYVPVTIVVNKQNNASMTTTSGNRQRTFYLCILFVLSLTAA